MPFLVQVRSFGDGCTAQDQTGVAVVGRRVDVWPLVTVTRSVHVAP